MPRLQQRPRERGRRVCLCAVLLAGTAASAFAQEAAPSTAATEQAAHALAQGDLEAAEAAYSRAAELEPQNPDHWMQLGIVRSRRGENAGAVTAYERVLVIEPGHARALNNLANVYYRMNDYARAAKSYAAALAVEPDYLVALLNLGRTLQQLGRSAEAEQRFGHCLELPAGNDRERVMQLDCRFYLGSLRFRAGDYVGCAALMERVLTDRPDHTEARYYLGMAYLRSGRQQEGVEQLEIHRRTLQRRRDTGTIERQDR